MRVVGVEGEVLELGGELGEVGVVVLAGVVVAVAVAGQGGVDIVGDGSWRKAVVASNYIRYSREVPRGHSEFGDPPWPPLYSCCLTTSPMLKLPELYCCGSSPPPTDRCCG